MTRSTSRGPASRVSLAEHDRTQGSPTSREPPGLGAVHPDGQGLHCLLDGLKGGLRGGGVAVEQITALGLGWGRVRERSSWDQIQGKFPGFSFQKEIDRARCTARDSLDLEVSQRISRVKPFQEIDHRLRTGGFRRQTCRVLGGRWGRGQVCPNREPCGHSGEYKRKESWRDLHAERSKRTGWLAGLARGICSRCRVGTGVF